MSILNVKPIAVGVAFFFFALIAGATADDANAKRWNNQYNYNSGYGGGYYPYYRRYPRYRGGYYNNGWGWPNYGGIGFGFGFGNGFGYPYYSNRYYDNPYYFSPYYNNFPGYYDTPYYYRRSSTVGRCGARWTKSWRRCCDARFQSFNPETGRYLTYSGRWKYCR